MVIEEHFACASEADKRRVRLRSGHAILRPWGEIAEAHPKIAKTPAYNSVLMNDGTYLPTRPGGHILAGAS